MTSPYATNAKIRNFGKKYLASDKEGFPLDGQVPKKVLTIGTAGAASLPEDCPELVVLSNTAAVTNLDVNCKSPNLIGKRILFSKVAGAQQHEITFSGLTVKPLITDKNVVTLTTDVNAAVEVAFVPIDDNGAGVIMSKPIIVSLGTGHFALT